MILPNNISKEQIEEELDAIISAQQDGEKWLEFYNGAHGAVIKNWLASVGTFLTYNAIASRKQSNPITSKLKTSLYNAAYLFGYPINRSVANENMLTINNIGASVFVDKDIPICYFSGYPVSLVKSQQIPRGVSTVKCIIGSWHSQETTIDKTTNYYEEKIVVDEFTDVMDICSKNLLVYVNGEPKATSKFTEDIQNNKVIDNTLHDGVMLLFGGISGGILLNKNDVVLTEWFQVADTSANVNAIQYSETTYSSDLTFEFVSAETIFRQTSPDSLNKISKLIPGYYASRRRAVTPEDHSYIISSMPGMQSAKFGTNICTVNELTIPTKEECLASSGSWDKAVEGCCTNKVAYVREDLEQLTDSEEEELYKELSDKYLLAGAYLLFQKGIPVTVMPKLAVQVDASVDTTILEPLIKEMIKAMCYELGGTFSVAKLISQINTIPGVRYSSIIRPRNDLSLSWVGYFKEGKLDLEIVTETSELLSFGTEEGGYLLYSDTITGFNLKSYIVRPHLMIGNTLTIEGYTAYNGEVLGEQKVVVTLGTTINSAFTSAKTFEYITKSDGTFTCSYPIESLNDVKLNTAIVSSTMLNVTKTETLSFEIAKNNYQATHSIVGEAIIGDTIKVSVNFTKNGEPLINGEISIIGEGTNLLLTTDLTGTISFDHVVASSSDKQIVLTYTDVYGQILTYIVTLDPHVAVFYDVYIETDKQDYLVGQTMTTSVLVYGNGDPIEGIDGSAVYVKPVFKGVEAKDTSRVLITDEDGRATTTYLISNELVELGMDSLNAYFYIGEKLQAQATCKFTLALNPNGTYNGF